MVTASDDNHPLRLRQGSLCRGSTDGADALF